MSYTYNSPAIGQYQCGTDSASTIMMVQATYAGEDDGAYNIYSGSVTGSLPPVATESMSGMNMPMGSSSSSVPSIIISTASMYMPSVVTTTAAAASATHASSHSSSSSVGPIVGGVVGGLAVIGIIVGVVVWMCLRARRRRTPPPSVSERQHQLPNSHASYYAPPSEKPPGEYAFAPDYFASQASKSPRVRSEIPDSPAGRPFGSESWSPPPLHANVNDDGGSDIAPWTSSTLFPGRHDSGVVHEAPDHTANRRSG